MKNNFIFQNVNINTISFINNKNDLRFEFLDSFVNSGKYCGELICLDFISLNIHTDLEDDSFFPQFICDITAEHTPDKEKKYIVKFQGGSYDIKIICKNIEIINS